MEGVDWKIYLIFVHIYEEIHLNGVACTMMMMMTMMIMITALLLIIVISFYILCIKRHTANHSIQFLLYINIIKWWFCMIDWNEWMNEWTNVRTNEWMNDELTMLIVANFWCVFVLFKLILFHIFFINIVIK